MDDGGLQTNQNYAQPRSQIITNGRWKARFWKGIQIIHFLIAMAYLWAGLVEFINNPPYFDAYGDATFKNTLPSGIFKNDPRLTEESLLRLMDAPILATLLKLVGFTNTLLMLNRRRGQFYVDLLKGYVLVSLWLKFRGASWLITASLTVTFLCFWVVNFWAKERFDWRYFSTRMRGLELQVSFLALSTTTVFMVLFERRKRMPFKFKSSLRVRKLGKVHITWNFIAIYLIVFTSMLLWFTKLYSSWACFRTHEEILEICQTTNQVALLFMFPTYADTYWPLKVQCIPCDHCHVNGFKRCKDDFQDKTFSCDTPTLHGKGAVCIFNYNMGIYGYLSTFAYIGGLCVFLSTFAGIFGHYFLRALFLLHDLTKSFGRQSNQYFIYRTRNVLNRTSEVNARSRELRAPGAESPVMVLEGENSDSDDNFGNWINASCG